VLSSIPADDDIRRKSASYQIIGRPGTPWAPLFESLAKNVAEAPPQQPRTLTHEALLGLFKGSDVGRGVVLEQATLEDMCGTQVVARPSLEVIYEQV